METRIGTGVWRRGCAIGALLAGLHAPAPAQVVSIPSDAPDSAAPVEIIQSVARRPGLAGRVVRLFDFEEMETNPGEVPRDWFRGQDSPANPRPGFPAWNQARLSYTDEGGIAFDGNGSVRLPTRGGNTSLILGPGTIPVFAGADYEITAAVRTAGLKHARARIVARLLDASGVPIPGTQADSNPIQSESAWTPVRVVTSGRAGAAFLQVELLVVQPDRAAARPGGETTGQPGLSDVDAAAWFDQVRVVQLPRVSLATQRRTNIIGPAERPLLRADVRDLTGEAMTVRVRVTDRRGTVVSERTIRGGAGSALATWEPDLPGFGWYEATLELMSGDTPVGNTRTRFVWLSPDAGVTGQTPGGGRRVAGAFDGGITGVDLARFGVELTDGSPEALRAASDVLGVLNVGAVSFPVWRDDLTVEDAAAWAESLAPAVAGLHAGWRDVALRLDRAPRALAAATRRPEWAVWGLIGAPDAAWTRYSAPLFEDLEMKINRWRLGGPEAGDVLARTGALRPELTRASSVLSRWVAGPTIEASLSAEEAWPGMMAGWSGPAASLSVRAGEAWTPAGLGELTRAYAQALAGQASAGGWSARLIVDAPTRAGMDHSLAAAQTAARVVEFWAGLRARPAPDAAANAEPADGPRGLGLSIEQPWAVAPRAADTTLAPTPEFVAWAVATAQVSGRRVIGEFPVGPGIRCLILAPAKGSNRTGALVAWDESGAGSTLRSVLSAGGVEIIDLDGNRRPARTEPGPEPDSPPISIVDVGPEPVFIDGVDVPLVRFLAGIRLDPPQLDARSSPTDRSLRLDNPWPTGMSGSISILEPGGFLTGDRDRSWRISPRTVPFAAPAGETHDARLTLAFGSVQEIGSREFVFRVVVTAAQSYGAMDVRRPVEISVPGLTLEVTAIVDGPPADGDVIIEAIVGNSSPAPVDIALTAFAPDLPRQKSSVSQLMPGQQAVRRFVYPRAARKLRDQLVLVSAEVGNEGLRLNRSVRSP